MVVVVVVVVVSSGEAAIDSNPLALARCPAPPVCASVLVKFVVPGEGEASGVAPVPVSSSRDLW